MRLRFAMLDTNLEMPIRPMPVGFSPSACLQLGPVIEAIIPSRDCGHRNIPRAIYIGLHPNSDQYPPLSPLQPVIVSALGTSTQTMELYVVS